jgi:hypothetical protein
MCSVREYLSCKRRATLLTDGRANDIPPLNMTFTEYLYLLDPSLPVSLYTTTL